MVLTGVNGFRCAPPRSAGLTSLTPPPPTLVQIRPWLAKAAAAGVSPSDLLRQAMARTRTWTAAASEIERERTRQVARIGNNLNQIARWANTQAKPIDAVEIIVYLIAIEREVARMARFGGERQEARGPSR